jgi:two-component system, LytTR family, sensor kinase
LISNTDKTSNIKFRRWWRSGFIIFAFFTFLTILNLPDIYFYYQQSPAPDSVLLAFGRLALTNYLWVILTPVIFRCGDIFPVGRPKLFRNLIIHIALGFIVGALYTIIFHLVYGLLGGETVSDVISVLSERATVFVHNVKNGFIYYVGIQTFNQAADYSRKYQDREFRLQQAELKALKSQLNPHFLFNTLNAVSMLVYRAPKDADRAITQLSDLLRMSLDVEKAEEIPLKQELDFLRAYLRIHQTLMRERLKVVWNVDPQTLDAAVPNLILQPIVENAVEHGLAPLKHGGHIEINSYRRDTFLYLEVRDDGIGLTDSEKNNLQTGIGISNTRARLSYLYSEDQEIKLTDGEFAGLSVTIKIPYRRLAGEK